MQTGMLWFDDTPRRSLSNKIKGAIEYYRQKYGVTPTLCYVHRAELNEGALRDCPIRVIGANDVSPNHIWIGVGEPHDDEVDEAA